MTVNALFQHIICFSMSQSRANDCEITIIVFSLVGVGPASVMVGNLVAGKRIAQAAGRDLGMIEDQDLVRKVRTLSVRFLIYFI